MAAPTLANLQADVLGWLDRRDVAPLVAGWVAMAEADMAAQLRARCMIVAAVQSVDAPLISLPADWASMESLRDVSTGKLLDLEDDWTGPLQGDGGQAHAYRIVGECIEFLPWPTVPDPPQIGWQPQQVRMVWYKAPKPLRDPQDSNIVLEKHYSLYLFGVCKYGAMFELDDERAAQMEKAFTGALYAVNLWKETAQYSGAPLRAAPATAF